MASVATNWITGQILSEYQASFLYRKSAGGNAAELSRIQKALAELPVECSKKPTGF
jgi:hypothetical protein